jgi:TPR repeat protein
VLKGLNWLTKAADSGDLDAQRTLGEIYYLHLFNCADDSQAKQLLTHASQKGSSIAYFLLSKNISSTAPAKRIAKIETLSKSHVAAAESTMGDLLANGLGRKFDRDQALGRYKKAAEQGEVDAQFQIAIASFYGYGKADQNLAECRSWLEKSAAGGNSNAQQLLAQWILAGLSGRIDKPTAVSLLKRSAALGNSEAQNTLGSLYVIGDGVPLDTAQAIKLLTLSAEQGNVESQDYLSSVYAWTKDYDKGDKWRKRAADMGYTPAELSLGLAQEDSAYIKKAADQGDVDATIALAKLYADGSDGVEADTKKCVTLYTNAAEEGSTKAQCILAEMYRYGDLVTEKNEACKWYKLAASQGSPEAIQKLKDINDEKPTGNN